MLACCGACLYAHAVCLSACLTDALPRRPLVVCVVLAAPQGPQPTLDSSSVLASTFAALFLSAPAPSCTLHAPLAYAGGLTRPCPAIPRMRAVPGCLLSPWRKYVCVCAAQHANYMRWRRGSGCSGCGGGRVHPPLTRGLCCDDQASVSAATPLPSHAHMPAATAGVPFTRPPMHGVYFLSAVCCL